MIPAVIPLRGTIRVRQLASCMGAEAPVSVRGLFLRPPPLPGIPMSVRQRAEAPMQRKVDLNAICVGVELFDSDDGDELQEAIDHVREVFAQVDIGVGQVHYYGIPLAEANGHEDIDDHGEMHALVEEFGAPGTAVDIFFVRSYAGDTVGRSPIGGTCDPGDAPNSGLVVAIDMSAYITGHTLAHELAHYLGVEHSSDQDNLMWKFVDTSGSELSRTQRTTMQQHCILRRGCRR